MYRIFITLLFVFVSAINVNASELKSGEFSPARMAPDFKLQSSNGKELKLSDYRGKVVALMFGFTSCPHICPMTMMELVSVKKELGANSRGFQVVFVTVDPKQDTAERLKTYLANFDSSFVGVTGTPEQINFVQKDYGAAIQTKSKSSEIDHSSFVYLIDRVGKLRAVSPYGQLVEDLVPDVQALLAQ
jgi:protein SCO1/2